MGGKMNLIGEIFGGMFAIFVLQQLWEFMLFKRILNESHKIKIASIAAAYLTSGILGGFGFAGEGEIFTLSAFGTYLIPALVVAGLTYWGEKKRRKAQQLTGTLE
jgi:hypothetical protein